jgi:HEPN domain-containing protein
VADNHPEAAEKHVLDSEALLKVNRYDGAGYLAGYAVECTLKTLILIEGHRMRGHNLNELSIRALALASVPTQKTAKYINSSAITTITYGHGPQDWNESLRYEPEGAIKPADCLTWVSEARRLYDGVIWQMKLDGLLA